MKADNTKLDINTSRQHTAFPVQDVLPGYKRTDVGVIPEDWDVVYLRSIVHFTNGKAHEEFVADDGPFILVNSRFISTDGLTKKYSNRCLSPASVGDVLMVMSDVPNGRAIARCYFVDKENTYTVNQRICCLTATNIEKKLLYFKLDRNPFYVSFDDGVNQTNLRKEDVLGCPLGLPTNKIEQRAIAQALSDVDSLIEALDKLIAKKQAIKQAAMQQLLTGKTRLPGFSGEWSELSLGSLLNRVLGGGTPSRSNKEFWGGTIPWMTVKDFATFSPYATQESITEKGLVSSAAHLVPKGTVIVSTRMAVGRACIYEVPVAINQDLKALLTVEQLIPKYLLLWLENNRSHIETLGSGSTVKGLSVPALRGLKVFLPPPKEQRAIATVLSDMYAEIEALERRRDKTKKIKQGMMQQLLTGRVRLIKPEAA